MHQCWKLKLPSCVITVGRSSTLNREGKGKKKTHSRQVPLWCLLQTSLP